MKFLLYFKHLATTHDARAVTTVNKGPMQRKHTKWAGWTAGRRLQ